MTTHTCDVCAKPALDRSTVEHHVPLQTPFGVVLVRMTFNRSDKQLYGTGAQVHLCDACRRAAAELFIGAMRT